MTHRTPAATLQAACRELTFRQQDLADLIGVSVRTVQRHGETSGLTLPSHYAKLVAALQPRNPALAAEVAAIIGRTPAELGVQVNASAQAAPAPQRATRVHAEAVVCAAADAIGVIPRDARPIVAAIFQCARGLEVDLPSLSALLAEHPAKTS